MLEEYVVYRIRNKETGRIYIGSSKQIKKRIATHLNGINKKNHENPKIRFDSIWCKTDSWSIKVVARFSTEKEMLEYEEKLIRVYFGRPCSYNVSIGAIKKETTNYIALWKKDEHPKIYGGLHAMARGENLDKRKISQISPGIYLIKNQLAINPSLLENTNAIPSEITQDEYIAQFNRLLKSITGNPNGITYDSLQYATFRISQTVASILRTLIGSPVGKKEIIDDIIEKNFILTETPEFTINSCIQNNLIVEHNNELCITEKGANIIWAEIRASTKRERSSARNYAQKFPHLIENTSPYNGNIAHICMDQSGIFYNYPHFNCRSGKITHIDYTPNPTHLLVATNSGDILSFIISRNDSVEILNSKTQEKLDGKEIIVSFCLVNNAQIEDRNLTIITKLGARCVLSLKPFITNNVKKRAIRIIKSDSVLTIINSSSFDNFLFVTNKSRYHMFSVRICPELALGSTIGQPAFLDAGEFYSRGGTTGHLPSRTIIIFHNGNSITISNNLEYHRYPSNLGFPFFRGEKSIVEVVIPFHFTTHFYKKIQLFMSDGSEVLVDCEKIQLFHGEFFAPLTMLDNWHQGLNIIEWKLEGLVIN